MQIAEISTQIVDQIEPGQQFVLKNITWDAYESILEELDASGRHLRVTYDRGCIQFMSPLPQHDFSKSWIGRLIESMALELDIDILSGGSTTWKRKDLAHGLEADECYYIRNEARVRGHEADLKNDPPPDLAVEIELTKSSLDRREIYGALGVPELWCYDDTALTFLLLQRDGSYAQSDTSLNFPGLRVSDMERFIKLRGTDRDNVLVRNFISWVGANLKKM